MSDSTKAVITGIGAICGLGHNITDIWSKAKEGQSGISAIAQHPRFENPSTVPIPVKSAGLVRDFQIDESILDLKERDRFDLFIHFALHASEEALKQAALNNQTYEAHRIGVILGVGMGGFPFIESQHEKILGSKRPRTTPFFIPSLIPNMASGLLSIKKGFKGTNFSISSACASSGHAIEIGMRLIQAGALDAVVVGGAEAVVTPLTTAGFHSMKALSKRDVDPQLASCPFSKNRDGFVIAEGAGVLILENKEKAKNRGQKLLAEIAAASSSADAFHITAPAKDGSGAMACMRGALTEAGIKPEEIDYINAHGTSTPIGDKVETEAIKNVFGEYSNKVNISSTKSMSGHLLGAAAGLESALCVQSLIEQQILPTANLTEPDELCDLNYTPLKAVNKPLRYVMNNSFGFGGTNSCIIFKHT